MRSTFTERGVLIAGATLFGLAACTLGDTEGLTGGSPDAGAGAATTTGGDSGHPANQDPSSNDGGTTTQADGGTNPNPTPPPPGTNAPTFVNASAADGSSTSITIQVPAEAQAGDFLFATVYAATTPVTVTPPAGWTTRKALPNCYSSMYWAYAYAQDAGTSATFTLSTGASSVGAISVYRGVAASSPFDTDLGQTFYNTKSVTLSSVTTSVAPDLLVVLAINDEGIGQSWSGAGGLQKRLDNGSVGVFDMKLATAGAVEPGTVTATGSTPCGSIEIAALHP